MLKKVKCSIDGLPCVSLNLSRHSPVISGPSHTAVPLRRFANQNLDNEETFRTTLGITVRIRCPEN